MVRQAVGVRGDGFRHGDQQREWIVRVRAAAGDFRGRVGGVQEGGSQR